MLLMVLVNAGSSAIYAPLRHAEWHGFTFADWVFPSFLWIVGITTTISIGRRKATVAKSTLSKQVVMRALKLYVLGLCIYAAPAFNPSTQRILGVLQRIAICYLAGALLYLYTSKRTQLICIGVLLLGYWALLMFVPAPGFRPGDLSLEGNLAHYVDRIVLGSHNYAGTKTWDPEGILSTFPALATLLIGVLMGEELARPISLQRKMKTLFFCGAAMTVAGLLWNPWFPINKKLWTSSFVLLVAGLDALLLPLFLFWIDVRGRHRSAKPLIVMGMNAIAIYLLSEFLDEILSFVHFQNHFGMTSIRSWVFKTCFEPIAPPALAALLYAAAYTFLMYLAAAWLYRRRLFLRV